ncbi:MAG: chemotaxis response regulator protein-glutamate methylesterase [Pseudomonadota bacterium]
MNKIRILIVDDSAVFRHFLEGVLEKEPAFSVVGSASDALEAAERIAGLKPDVITLDVEMPGMNGIAFLRKLMQNNPLPVVMVSSFTEENGALTIEALANGAVDFVLKPFSDGSQDRSEFATEIIGKIKIASHGRIVRHPAVNRVKWAKADPIPGSSKLTRNLIAVGASTGGTGAVCEILRALPPGIPPTVIVQHMPGVFTGLYARRLDELCHFSVKQADDMEELRPGNVYIAPGDRHLIVESHRSGWRIRLIDSPPINYHKPCIDLFFESVADTLRANALGIILTGMGNDGAKGLLAMRQRGAFTIAQDESTSLIFGMPRAAIKLNASCEVVPIDRIPGRIMACLSGEGSDG